MNSMKCPHCGLVNWATAEECKRCHFSFAGSEAVNQQQQAVESDSGYYQEPAAPEGYYNEPAQQWDYNNAYQGGQYSYAGNAGYAGHAGYGGQAGYAGYGGYAPMPKKSGLAIASLVIGILNFMACGLMGLGTIAGLITGIAALRKAKRSPMEYDGQGYAIAGIVLSSISIFYIGIVFAIAIPNLLASRRAANEAGAIGSLRTLAEVEQTYQATAGNGQYGTLQQLRQAGLIDESLASSIKYRYVFKISLGGRPGSGGYYDNITYEILATPVRDGDPSSRSFYLSSDEQFIRAAKKGGAEANSYDPPLSRETPAYRQASAPDIVPRDYSHSY